MGAARHPLDAAAWSSMRQYPMQLRSPRRLLRRCATTSGRRHASMWHYRTTMDAAVWRKSSAGIIGRSSWVHRHRPSENPVAWLQRYGSSRTGGPGWLDDATG